MKKKILSYLGVQLILAFISLGWVYLTGDWAYLCMFFIITVPLFLVTFFIKEVSSPDNKQN